MSDLRTAALRALEALEYYRSGEDYQPTPSSEAITSLKAALAQQAEPVQEPVAWIHEWKPNAPVIGKSLHWFGSSPHFDDVKVTPLYAAPPQRPADPQEPDPWGAGYEAGYAAGMAERPAERLDKEDA